MSFHGLLWVLTGVSLCLQSVSSHSVSRAASSPDPPDTFALPAGGIGGFPVFGGGYPSSLSHMEEGGFEQDEGKAEVTCM